MSLPKPFYSRGGIQIFCADCLDLLPLLEAGSVDAVVTDPPYGIDYQSARRIDRAMWKPKIANDCQPFVWFLPSCRRIAADYSCLLCFCRWDVQEAFRLAIGWAAWDVKSQIIWDRESHGMGDLNGCPAPQHDVIWFATKGRFEFHGDRPKSVVRSLRLGGDELSHPNQKPESLMDSLAADYCRTGGTILDPFLGSGTTAVACIRTGRKCIGIEIEEKYCEIAAKRCDRELDQQKLPFAEEPQPIPASQREMFQ